LHLHFAGGAEKLAVAISGFEYHLNGVVSGLAVIVHANGCSANNDTSHRVKGREWVAYIRKGLAAHGTDFGLKCQIVARNAIDVLSHQADFLLALAQGGF
jgi:hypothetical protein